MRFRALFCVSRAVPSVRRATLVLFYDSRRLSRDLDLLAKTEVLPSVSEITRVIETSIQPLGEIFGLGRLEFQSGSGKEDFIKLWVKSNERRLFSVDLTRIGSTVLKAEEVRKQIADSDQKVVITPSADALLFQKCETFLERRIVKSRDAFDINVLLARRAKLGENQGPS